jgi:hypothetical protein
MREQMREGWRTAYPHTLGVQEKVLWKIIVEFDLSKNPRPPKDLRGDKWNAFRKSKEYRGYTWIKPMLCCKNGTPEFSTKKDAHRILTNSGYTPIRRQEEHPSGGWVTVTDMYSAGEGDSDWAIAGSKKKGCLTIKLKNWYRIGWLGQLVANSLLPDVGVPWVSVEIHYEMCCNREYSIDYYASYFPSHFAYLDEQYVGEKIQTDMGKAVFAGDRTWLTMGKPFVNKQGKV